MTKATDGLLGELHGRLTKAMLASLASCDTATDLLNEYRAELPEAVTEFLEKLSDVNPSLLTAIAKFLKDNAITCAIEDNDEMSELEKRLVQKRKRVGNVIPMT
jgi:hypothetical protein